MSFANFDLFSSDGHVHRVSSATASIGSVGSMNKSKDSFSSANRYSEVMSANELGK